MKIGDYFILCPEMCMEDLFPMAEARRNRNMKEFFNLYQTAPRWVPVRGVDHWNMWLVINEIQFRPDEPPVYMTVPVLFKILGHYRKHRKRLDLVKHWPVEIATSQGPALALLGFGIHRSDDEVWRHPNPNYYSLPEEIQRLRKVYADGLRGKL